MNDQREPEDNQSPPPPPASTEEPEPIDRLTAAPTPTEQLAKVEKQMSGFEKATLRWAKTAVILSALAALFVCAQWYEMHTGGVDTHNLAIAAGDQATAAKAQVEQLKRQAGDTHDLAVAAKAQSDNTKAISAATRQQATLLLASQIPFISLKESPWIKQVVGPTIAIRWTHEWENSGGSKPVGLSIWEDCRNIKPGERLDFYKRANQGLPLVIAPHSTRKTGGCEATLDTIKHNNQHLPTPADGYSVFILFGGANYKDFLGKRHTVEYCYQPWWDNPFEETGFQMIQCLPPNEGHNCTDEECKEHPKPN